MNSDQDILEYLNSFSNDRLMTSSALFSDFKETKDTIASFFKKHPELTKLRDLNKLRLLSSNTLRKTLDQSHLDAC